MVAPWLPPGQLHGISSTSPSSPCCPVCCMCIGASTAGGARGSEVASTAYSFGDFPRKDALDARLPPPASRHARSGDGTHDLSVARPTLSPVELAGDPCVCVCVCVCLCLQWYPWGAGALVLAVQVVCLRALHARIQLSRALGCLAFCMLEFCVV